MKKNLIFIVIMILFIIFAKSVFADYRSATVDGFCYLEEATDHSGTKVLFNAVSASANTDSIITNIDGSFLIGLTEGIYTVHYSHEGWQPYTIPGEIEFFADSTLATVTLFAMGIEVTGPQSGVWSAGYTYNVMDDISVDNGDTLIIEPGVTVIFMDYYSFTIYGKLISAGTENDTILFTSRQLSWNPGDWNNIKFESNSDSNSVISYSKIEYAHIGIYCSSSSPTISNNTISNNNDIGIYCDESSPTISNNTISNNFRGIECYYSSSPTISNNTISNNNSHGIYCDESSPTISNNTISNNNSRGIECYYSSSPTISNNTISNSTYGIYCRYSSSPSISNNTISNNNQIGISCRESSPSISNNTISNNNQIGISCHESSPTISNNTISNNNRGIYCSSSSPTILSNILYDNNYGISECPPPLSLEYNLFWLNDYSCSSSIIPSAFGEIVTVNANGDSCDTYYNLFMDPLFVNPDSLDYHLTENSPCIDAGNPDSTYYDPDGTIADMGAFYYDQGSAAPVINDFTATPTEGSAPLVVQFSQDITGPVTEYHWFFEEGGTSNIPNPVYVYTVPDTYSVSLTVTGPGGSNEMIKTDYITVLEQHLPPNANFSAEPLFGIVPLYVDFFNLSSGEIDSLLWNFGNGSTSNEINPSYTYQDTGSFSVSLTAYGPYGTDTETKLDYIEVIEPQAVIAAFDVSTNIGVAPLTVIFINRSAGTIDSLLWDFGDGETSLEENPLHVYNEQGEYAVILTVYGQINSDTAEDTIIVALSEPDITSIEDVPEDQGHYVTVTWQKSYYDESGSISPIVGYNLWEMYPYELDRECIITNDINKAITRSKIYFSRNDTIWVLINYLAAMQWDEYTALAETFVDSSSIGNYLSYFFISAHTTDPSVYYCSVVDSGYSIDNIAPDETRVYIVQNGSNIGLNWDEVGYGTFQGNSYPEINGIWYKIYAGDSPDFVCDETHLIDTVTDLNYDYPLTGEEKKFFKIVVSDQP
jgi:parallel beta-helix repeat protein